MVVIEECAHCKQCALIIAQFLVLLTFTVKYLSLFVHEVMDVVSSTCSVKFQSFVFLLPLGIVPNLQETRYICDLRQTWCIFHKVCQSEGIVS